MIDLTVEVAPIDDLTNGTDITDQICGATADVSLNEEGAGSILIPYGETITPDPVGQALVYYLEGTPVHAAVCDVTQPVELAAGEESEMVTSYSGRGLASVLDRYRFRPTLGVGKAPWSTKRTYSVFDPIYDFSSWDDAIEIAVVGETSARYTGLPNGHPHFEGLWIGPPGTDDLEAPAGYWWWLDELTLAEDTLLAFFTAGDNRYTFWIDGMLVADVSGERVTKSGFSETHLTLIFLTAGTHRLGAKVINLNVDLSDPGYGEGASVSGNPTAFTGVAYDVDGRGALGALIWETTTDIQVLAFPDDPPGLTIPDILDAVITENTDDGIEPVVTLTANGTWDELETVTVDVGASLLKVLRDDWSELYLDWRLPPTELDLEIWPAGERGAPSGITFGPDAHPTTGNLRHLDAVTVDADTDCLLVSYHDGWLRFPTDTGTRMGFLSTQARSLREAEVVASYVLAQPDQPTQVNAEIAPTDAEIPGINFDCGDTVTIGSHSDQRALRWSFDFSDRRAGEPIFDLDVGFRIPTDASRLGKTVRTLLGGGLGGYAPATPTFEPPPFGSQIRSSDVTFRPIPPYDVGEADVEKRPVASGNLYAVAVTAKTAGSTNTIFEFLVNDVDVLGGNGLLVSTSLYALIPVDPIVWVEGNSSRLSVYLDTIGTGVDGLLFEPRFL